MSGVSEAPEKSINYYFMELTFLVSEGAHTSIFDVLKQDTDEVIEVINYLIQRGETAKYEDVQAQAQQQAAQTKRGHDIIWNYI